jgi:hypothetical protein
MAIRFDERLFQNCLQSIIVPPENKNAYIFLLYMLAIKISTIKSKANILFFQQVSIEK